MTSSATAAPARATSRRSPDPAQEDFCFNQGKTLHHPVGSAGAAPLRQDLPRQDPATFPPGEPLTMDAAAPQALGIPLSSRPTSQLLGGCSPSLRTCSVSGTRGGHVNRSCAELVTEANASSLASSRDGFDVLPAFSLPETEHGHRKSLTKAKAVVYLNTSTGTQSESSW